MPADIPMPHPGVVLREEFLEPMGLSVYALAKAIHVTRSRINDICNGRQGVTAAIALRLGRFFDVDPQWFMNMQSKYDLHVEAERLNADWPRSNRVARREGARAPTRAIPPSWPSPDLIRGSSRPSTRFRSTYWFSVSHRSNQPGFVSRISRTFHARGQCLMFDSRWIASMIRS